MSHCRGVQGEQYWPGAWSANKWRARLCNADYANSISLFWFARSLSPIHIHSSRFQKVIISRPISAVGFVFEYLCAVRCEERRARASVKHRASKHGFIHSVLCGLLFVAVVVAAREKLEHFFPWTLVGWWQWKRGVCSFGVNEQLGVLFITHSLVYHTNFFCTHPSSFFFASWLARCGLFADHHHRCVISSLWLVLIIVDFKVSASGYFRKSWLHVRASCCRELELDDGANCSHPLYDAHPHFRLNFYLLLFDCFVDAWLLSIHS